MSGQRRHRARRAAALVALALASPAARADEPEAIRFASHAPAGCVAQAELVTQIEALGGELRSPREDERARQLDVTIAREKITLDVRLVVHDLVGRVTERRVQSADCRAAAKAASLLVVLALDEPHPERPPASDPSSGQPVASAPAFWPAPARDDSGTTGMRVVPGDRLGSGGLLVSGAYGFTDELQEIGTLGAMAVGRVGDTTRIGASLTFARDFHETQRDELLYTTRGWSGRLGAVFGWGAPWNDGVVGFATELGAALGEQHGNAYAARPLLAGSSCSTNHCVCSGPDCFALGEAHESVRWFVSPFASWSLLFQVPLKKSPVRPVAGLVGTWVPLGAHGPTFGSTTTLGAVWQAW